MSLTNFFFSFFFTSTFFKSLCWNSNVFKKLKVVNGGALRGELLPLVVFFCDCVVHSSSHHILKANLFKTVPSLYFAR